MSSQVFVVLEICHLKKNREFQFEVPNPVVGCCEYSQKLQILGANATAPLLLVSEKWRFFVILKIFNELRYKKITK